MKTKTTLSLYCATLSFLLGLGTLLNFRISLLEASIWSFVWPLLLATLFFTISVRLFLIFWNRLKAGK
jgi:hypothetical protein